MHRRQFLSQLALLGAPLSVTLGCKPKAHALPELGAIPRVALTNQEGRATTLEEFRGTPIFVAFFFTRCPSVCPRVVARLKEVDVALGPSTKAQFALISVDPEFDSPEVLRAYASKYELKSARYSLFTGEHQAISAAAENGFKIGLVGTYAANEPGLGITHGSHVVLVDGRGLIRKYIRTFDDDAVDEATRAFASL